MAATCKRCKEICESVVEIGYEESTTYRRPRGNSSKADSTNPLFSTQIIFNY
jgi:hypothetical protein